MAWVPSVSRTSLNAQNTAESTSCALSTKIKPDSRGSSPAMTTESARAISLILVGLADMMLRVELEPELGHEIELRLQKIDVLFLVGHQLLEQIARDVILDGMAISRSLLIELPRRELRAQIGVEDLLDGLADVQRIDHL